MKTLRDSIGLVLVSACAMAAVAGPQQGQIVVDPDNPARMVYHDTYITVNDRQILKPCVFAGPGDPEDFFHNDTEDNLDLLTSKGARCTYITAWLKDFGGGSPPSDISSWDAKITELQDAGIITVFFLFDDSRPLPSGWENAVGDMVDTFKKHKLFIWSVAEEYGEQMSTSQVSEVAEFIAERDDYDHVIGVHQNSSSSFDFNSDTNLGMFLMQYNAGTPDNLHAGCVSAWNNLSGKKILNMAEAADHGKQDRATMRAWNWASIMGGASAVQILWMGRATDPSDWNEQGKYDDCAELMDFFEKTDINTMVPGDDLAAGSTQWVLANEGVSYIAYTDNLSGEMGLKGMSPGAHTLTWLDIGSNATRTTTETAQDGENTFSAPSGFDGEVAVWITGGESSEPPVVTRPTTSPRRAGVENSDRETVFALPGARAPTLTTLSGRCLIGRGPLNPRTWRMATDTFGRKMYVLKIPGSRGRTIVPITDSARR